MTKEQRLEKFQQRLMEAAPARNYDEAFALMVKILNEVEDEFSGIPKDPNGSKTDGRLYPPQEDNRHIVKGQPRIQRLRSKAHETFIGDNGSIEIRLVGSHISVLSKKGADGYFVKEL